MASQESTNPDGPPQGGEHFDEAPFGEQDGQASAPTTDQGQDAGGRAHTGLDEEHPAGEGERSDRETGGPTPAGDAEPGEGSATGDRPTEGFESH
jgi:hypothetical protein